MNFLANVVWQVSTFSPPLSFVLVCKLIVGFFVCCFSSLVGIDLVVVVFCREVGIEEDVPRPR